MLSDRDRAVLEFERKPWRWTGAKHAAILELFGMTPTRYQQVLDWILRQPDATEYDPAHVTRLRRVMANRRRPRSRRYGYAND